MQLPVYHEGSKKKARKRRIYLTKRGGKREGKGRD